MLLAPILLLNTTGQARADCSCTTNGGISTIGIEALATNCPPEPFSDNYVYHYITNNIKCLSENISYGASWGDSTISPTNMQNYWVSNGYRVLRNPAGSHMVIIHPSYTGVVAGVNMNNLAAAVYYATPQENLNEYCTEDGGLSDTDGDNFPDCLDCIPNDPANEGSCISTSNNLGQCFD